MEYEVSDLVDAYGHRHACDRVGDRWAEFPERFARYARSFAERYPDTESYAPINEPLTTARFSGLYGVWYPHARDARTFARILLAQCRGVALAMREVRAVNPAAELVLNDDLGRAHSTARLAYQAEFENELSCPARAYPSAEPPWLRHSNRRRYRRCR